MFSTNNLRTLPLDGQRPGFGAELLVDVIRGIP